ncbi:GntR family transcriptional regulator [Methylobacterium sp. ID0610]|uniref:GntR family transcriptional regulator n=1 Tax=Methylobacterium carpenticola TaxID=3344827 RepID=UPI0036CE3A3A
MTRTKPVRDQDGERRPSLVDDAYAAMKEAIRNSEFAPGYQASEQEIALRLGMSRTPVHEAAIRLQEDGLVRVLPRRGILICAIAPGDLREIYDVIVAIEGRAAEILAALPEAERGRVAALLAAETDAMAQAQERGDLPAWGRADEVFHRILVEQAGNRRMIRIMQTINDQSHRARMLTLKLRRELDASVAEHKSIIAAIRDADPAGAHHHARQHRIRARDALLPLLEDFGLRHL